jgi:molybdenum cofactor guanylyltransferase
MKFRDISAYILAGGKSRRFGEDKALFKYLGKPLIEHVIGAIRPVIDRIAIVGDNTERFAYLEIPCHADIIAGIGPMGGLYTALQRADTDLIFVFACDMPGLNTGLIRHMASLTGTFDAAVPLIKGNFEPLHALYSKSCIVPIEKSIDGGRRQIISFFNDVSIRQVTEDEISVHADPKLVFRNINFRSDAYE